MAIAPLIHETHSASYPSHRAPDTSDLLVSYLGQLGVQFVFGIPGGAIEPLYNALARGLRYGGPRPVVARHETGAAFMAQGYAAASGKLGVCCATTGPGATNALTGVASAYQDEVPLLVITGQTALHSFGKGALQESSCNGIDTLGIYHHCTRYNSLVSHRAQFEAKLIAALKAAFGAPAGPVHLTVPVDILRSPASVSAPSYDVRDLLFASSPVDERAVKTLWSELAGKKQLTVLVGDGCAEAVDHIEAFAERTGALIITTPGGKGLIDPYHPLYRGVFGFAGHQSARQALVDPAIQMVLAVGTAFSEWDTAGWDEAVFARRLVHIDSSAEHLARTPMANMHVHGRILTVFQRLIEYSERDAEGMLDASVSVSPTTVREESPNGLPTFLAIDDDEKPDASEGVRPSELMMELGHRFPVGTRFFADAGNSVAWAIHYLHVASVPGSRLGRAWWFRMSPQFTAMGWALGNAVGTAVAEPERVVVCITGDGSLLMNGQELSVAVAERLPVVFVVLNDSSLGMVKHGQRLAKAEPVAFELPRVDFAALARAMGAKGIHIRSLQELRDLDIDSLCRRSGPTLLDVYIDGESVPPMGTRVKVLGEEHGA